MWEGMRISGRPKKRSWGLICAALSKLSNPGSFPGWVSWLLLVLYHERFYPRFCMFLGKKLSARDEERMYGARLGWSSRVRRAIPLFYSLTGWIQITLVGFHSPEGMILLVGVSITMAMTLYSTYTGWVIFSSIYTNRLQNDVQSTDIYNQNSTDDHSYTCRVSLNFISIPLSESSGTEHVETNTTE
jgi:hypothetical protein